MHIHVQIESLPRNLSSSGGGVIVIAITEKCTIIETTVEGGSKSIRNNT